MIDKCNPIVYHSFYWFPRSRIPFGNPVYPKISEEKGTEYPMKIAIIGSRGYPIVYGGYETFVKELGERLVDSGHEVTIYSHKNLFNEYPPVVNGIEIKYIYTIEKKNLSQFIHSLQSIIHSLFCKYDVTLVLNPANGPFGIFTTLFRKKTAINIDGLEWRRPKWKGLGARYFYFAAKMATRLYDRVIADSNEMARVYREQFNCESTVIAYGASIVRTSSHKLIEKWGLDKLGYYLIVGRLIPDNNADLIVGEYRRSRTRKKLVIVGDVPYKSNFARAIKKTDTPGIILTGYIKDPEKLNALYLNCFLYLHGHEFGGTNPSLLKALGCGCAVSALDTPFNRETLKRGEYGTFFNKEAGNLSQLMEKWEESPEMAAEYREKSRNRILENYTWEKVTRQYIDLFNKMAG